MALSTKNIIKDEFGNYFMLLTNGGLVKLAQEPRHDNEKFCLELKDRCVGSYCTKWQKMGIYTEDELHNSHELGYCALLLG